jgi:hypothetical protein
VSTQSAEDYYADYRRRQHEYAARLVSAGPRPGHVLQFTTVDGARFLPFPTQAPLASVRAVVRSARGRHTVHEYDTTDRGGAALRVVYVRCAPGTWSGGEDVVDVYAIDQQAIAAL